MLKYISRFADAVEVRVLSVLLPFAAVRDVEDHALEAARPDWDSRGIYPTSRRMALRRLSLQKRGRGLL